MATDERPDINAEKFRVYVTANVDLESIAPLLACEWSEDGDGYDIRKATGTAQEICQIHRQSAPPGGEAYTTLFLIVDDPQPQTEGVLVINLKPEHGYPDAVRHQADRAGNAVASLSIGNSNWYDNRESEVEHKTSLVPEKWFALYDLEHSDDFETAVKIMNDGLQNVDVDEGRTTPEPEGVAKHYHVGARGDNLDTIQARHAEYAATHGLDPARFAVVDEKFVDEGALIVQLEPTRDRFRCKNPVAGEILGWIFIRFMTWEEAKQFAVEL